MGSFPGGVEAENFRKVKANAFALPQAFLIHVRSFESRRLRIFCGALLILAVLLLRFEAIGAIFQSGGLDVRGAS